MFASLCSTLSQAVLPTEKAARIIHSASNLSNTTQSADIDNHQEKEAEVVKSQCQDMRRMGEENGTEEEKVAS